MTYKITWRVLTLVLGLVMVLGVFSLPGLAEDTPLEAQPAAAQTCGNSWEARYYNDTNFTNLVWVDCILPDVNGWLEDGFGNQAIPASNFTATYQRQVTFVQTGTYMFDITVEDGIRVYVNGVLVVDAWGNSAGPREIQQSVNITNPVSLVYVEYLMTGTQRELSVEWILVSTSTQVPGGGTGGTQATATPACSETPSFVQPWFVEFFNTTNLQGPVIASGSTGLAGPLNFTYTGPPIVGVNADNWSARYTRQVDFQPGGAVKFTMFVDDVGTVFLDGQPVTASATTFQNTTYEATINVTKGSHVITVVMADLAAEGVIQVDWTGSASGGGSSCATQGGIVNSPTGVTATVAANVGLNFRECPSLSCTRITVLQNGQTYAVLGRNQDATWVQLDVNGTIGWALAEWLTFNGDVFSVPIVTPGEENVPPGGLPEGIPIRAVGNVRIRECPSLRCARITYVPWGTRVAAHGESENGLWLLISYDDPELGVVTGWSFKLWYFNDEFKLPLPEFPVIAE
ncbi:MAG: SH3 domain-containing protein [Chloroflexi bacterium]|nr:SH3 domain-containing protein [Chloroflexota bacterium]